MKLRTPITGTLIDVSDEKAAEFIERGFYQQVAPNPEEKPKPKRTRRTAKPKEQ